MEQLNSSNAQRGPSSLIGVLVLSKFPQYKTERLCLLLAGQNVTRQNKHSNSKLSHADKPRRHHHKLSPPGHILLQVLPHYVQDLRIHALSDCCLMSYFFFAAHSLNTSVAMYNQHSSNPKAKCRHVPHRRKHSTSKVNREVNSRLRRRLSLSPTPRLRHVLS
ncbi:hypothetical protein F4604DRAFT_921397 [Suillus subluteus]|nr:hypothetical protein F4604DRAFT_921397 [Suillus subluteus]